MSTQKITPARYSLGLTGQVSDGRSKVDEWLLLEHDGRGCLELVCSVPRDPDVPATEESCRGELAAAVAGLAGVLASPAPLLKAEMLPAVPAEKEDARG